MGASAVAEEIGHAYEDLYLWCNFAARASLVSQARPTSASKRGKGLVNCTVQCAGTRLVYAVHQTLPSLAEVGLACETRAG